MAQRPQVYKYRQPLKIGDTPTFHYRFAIQGNLFDWANIVADISITKVPNPVDNSGASVLRTNQAITVQPDNSAYLALTIKREEAEKLEPGNYMIEVQLRNTKSELVSTVFTGTITVVQDYIK